MTAPAPQRIGGIIVATMTPYRPDGAVCVETLGAHVEFLLRGGIPAVAPAGTTGEFLYLSEAERAEVVRETHDLTPELLPVLRLHHG